MIYFQNFFAEPMKYYKNIFYIDFLKVYMVYDIGISMGSFCLVEASDYWDLGSVCYFLVHLERWKT